jgi:hypothetical protein
VALEALLRLWADGPDSRMTLHDQLALAETQHPGRFSAAASRCRCESTIKATRVLR